MQKKSQGRFTPNVKFSIMGEKRDLLSSIGIPIMSNYIRTAFNGDIVDLCDCMTTFEKWQDAKEVSIYEAIPELIPDGMRYNKELDKLVPNIIENEKVKKVTTDEKFYINEISGDFLNKDEKINLRENGFFKADLDKTDFTLVCPYAYEDLAKQLTIGAKKYKRDNWQKGDILTYLAALERHVNDVKKALIENDNKALIDDTGINQGGALMFNAMAIHYFIRKILSGDENVK